MNGLFIRDFYEFFCSTTSMGIIDRKSSILFYVLDNHEVAVMKKLFPLTRALNT